jgi:hypothetical protein
MRRSPLIVVLPIALLYCAFLTRTYYWDGVLFALNIEGAGEPGASLAALMHPNHLLYSNLGYIAYRAAVRFGLHVRAITVLQLMNILASTVLAYLLFKFMKRFSASNRLASAACVLFAFGATWWKFSTDANAYILSVLLLSIAVGMAIERKVLLAGITHAAAMLMHELAIFGVMPILVATWIYRRTAASFAGYLAAAAIPVAAAYALAYRTVDQRAYPNLLSWVTSSSSQSQTTHSFTQLFPTNLVSYLKLFAGGRWSLLQQFLSPVVYISLACSICLLAYGVWLWFRAPANPSVDYDYRIPVVLGAWLLPYIVFLSWFEPGNAFYKLFIWPAIVLLVSLALRQHASALLAFALALTAWNFGAFIFPHSHVRADPVLELAKRIDRELPRNATIYYREFVPDDWYLRYFAPGRDWNQLPVKEKTTPGPVCFETTALEVVRVPESSKMRWHLVNDRHNVKLECLPEER